jgi:glyoxylase-like metal-dependent hydrolase (beta-lactamase superfamily II)
VLPTISPNIGAGEMRRSGMMLRFLNSLDRIAEYQADDLIVLPGHGPPFSNLAERVEQLRGHHRERETKILDVLRSGGPQTVFEIARSLWPRLPGYHLSLGTNEVNAHLEKAVAENVVRRDNGRFALL